MSRDPDLLAASGLSFLLAAALIVGVVLWGLITGETL